MECPKISATSGADVRVTLYDGPRREAKTPGSSLGLKLPQVLNGTADFPLIAHQFENQEPRPSVGQHAPAHHEPHLESHHEHHGRAATTFLRLLGTLRPLLRATCTCRPACRRCLAPPRVRLPRPAALRE